ncbi:MAG TPA: 50S ribosomal protein L11 methyltransferase [Longimicrobiaceae bacterium]
MSRPDRWLVLRARLPADDPLRDLLGEGLLALGGLSVVEEGEEMVTYLPPPPDPEAVVKAAARFLADWLMEDAPPELTWSWQDDEDWSREWKKGLEPRAVTPRIVTKPSWTEYAPAPGQIVIDIDPQMAFGTGEHATTRGCLRLLDRVIRPGDRVLDVGSGSGILSVAAAMLGAGEVVAVEYDPDANLNARENLAHNGVEERVRLVEAMADPALIEAEGSFDLILANILSGVIRPLLPAFRAALRPGGRLIVSGILQSESEAVAASAAAAGLRVEEEDREEEWWSALLLPVAS